MLCEPTQRLRCFREHGGIVEVLAVSLARRSRTSNATKVAVQVIYAPCTWDWNDPKLLRQ